jgi:copper chaperone CopZ
MHEHHTMRLDDTADNGQDGPVEVGTIRQRRRSSPEARHLVGGMPCPHCPAAIEKALLELRAIHQASVNLARGMGPYCVRTGSDCDRKRSECRPVGRLCSWYFQDSHSHQEHPLLISCRPHSACP